MKLYKLTLFVLGVTNVVTTSAQTQNSLLRKGNQLYKQGDFDKSLTAYEKAIQMNPESPQANFNTGNALFRKEKWEDAQKNFDNVITKSTDNVIREQAFYNKGVTLTKQKKLEESIEEYKNALRLNAYDEDARINLQKALLELKNKTQSKEQKEQKQEDKPKQKDKPKPQQSKLNKKEVERLLKALQQKEQEIQQKMQQNKNRAISQPEKDW